MKKKTLLIGIVLVGILMGTTAAQGNIPTPPKPEQVWPASWIALGTAILVVCDIISRAFGLYRVGAGKIERQLEEQTKHFDEKMAQLEIRLEQRFNGFTINAELRMNGYGKRLEDVESDQTGANAKVAAVEARMLASETDRSHIRTTLEEIKRGQETMLQYVLNQRRPS